MRALSVLILYPLIHLPLLLLNVWPLLLGFHLGWGISSIGIWILWSIPCAFIVVRMDRWPWWNRLRARILAPDK